jgi:hypothetical protein
MQSAVAGVQIGDHTRRISFSIWNPLVLGYEELNHILKYIHILDSIGRIAIDFPASEVA